MINDYTHIILADDDQDDRDFFSDAFNELKMETKVSSFNDGLQLMNYLTLPTSILPDILFLDLNMPFKSGVECLHEIKTFDRLKNIVIAIYSTSASDEDVEATFVSGANIYIKKPSNFDDLKKILKEVVTINWQYQTSGLNRDNFLLKL